MKIVGCHNFYQERGGEDTVFEDECALLEGNGHEIERFTRHNDEVNGIRRLRLASDTVWNARSARRLGDLIRRHRPDVLHVHNTLPLISPSIYRMARSLGVAVVQTLHNYRLLCPKGTLFRDGRDCEDCVGRRFKWQAVRHACYRDDRAATGVVAAMLATHDAMGTHARFVDAFISPSEFARRKLVEGGLPADRVYVKANFIGRDPGVRPGDGGYAIFVGRLSAEKGIDTLLRAWDAPEVTVPLRIVGDGPEGDRVRAAAAARPDRIEWVGRLPHEQVYDEIGRARFLVMPSVWYETFGRTIIEAFATSTPVVASRMGAMEELVSSGVNGVLFRPGDAADLAAQVAVVMANPGRLAEMRSNARIEYEQNYTAAQNYQQIMHVYGRALDRRDRVVTGNGRNPDTVGTPV